MDYPYVEALLWASPYDVTTGQLMRRWRLLIKHTVRVFSNQFSRLLRFLSRLNGQDGGRSCVSLSGKGPLRATLNCLWLNRYCGM
jgi:hypothetical protein